MITLDAATVLELPIDELSLSVLKDIKDTNSDNEFNYIYWYRDDAQSPLKDSAPAVAAIAEAVAWLRSRAMISHKPGDSRADSMLVTRPGSQSLEIGGAGIRAIERLQDNLHPQILQKARRQFLLGEYENAIFVAMKAVEVRVRELCGFGNEVIGVDLMTKAFKQDGPLADPTAPPGEVQGTMMLFAGSYAVLRNPSGHREVEFDDVTEASEAVITASLLMRILDKVEARLQVQ